MVVCWAFWISMRAAGRITDVVASLQNSALSHGVTIDPISDGAEAIRFAGAETSLDMRAHRKPSKRQKVSQASTAKDIRDMDNMTALTSDRLSNPIPMCCPETMPFQPQYGSVLDVILGLECEAVCEGGHTRLLRRLIGITSAATSPIFLVCEN